jgi:DNA topoisomerase-1
MDLFKLFFNNPIQYGGKIQSYDEKHYKLGIIRIKDKDIFKYVYTKNNKEISQIDLERILKLKIPPIWNYAWISNDPKSEIQVIGIDGKGKKQYLYTQEHKENASIHKFKNLTKLINLLPKLNDIIAEHSKLSDYSKKKVMTTMIKIILLSGIRAGKEYNVKQNKSYGVCSLRKKHVKLKNGKVYLKFKGKSNIEHSHILEDKDIYSHIEKLLSLKLSDKNDKLFLYIDNKTKKIKKADDNDLNRYLHKYLDKDIVIKDLRTYLVNYLLVKNLLNITNSVKKNNIKKNISESIKKTANFIQHTANICKKSYIHPKIINKYISDTNYFIKNKHKNILNVLLDILN